MSTESYIDSVRSHFADREEKVGTVISLLRRIVRNHAIFDHDSQGSPMGTPNIRWDQNRPNEEAWFDLYDQDHKQIEQARAVNSREHAVDFAHFKLEDDNGDYPGQIIAMTIEVHPPNVKGYDDMPLTSPQLDGAIADIKRYEGALPAGNVGE